MISYASIDRIEGEYVVCEVELLPRKNSKPEDFAKKDTVMMDVPLQKFPEFLGKVEEGAIFVVAHNGKKVNIVYFKDEEERARRSELLRRMWS